MPYAYTIEQVRAKHDGVLTIISASPNKIKQYKAWNCQCVCGKKLILSSTSIVKGKSCGCLNKHGEVHTRLYNTWHNIKQKCLNGYSVNYKKHNTLQKDWRSYKNFRDWAITNGYNDTKRIKRADARLGFNEDNCSWYK